MRQFPRANAFGRIGVDQPRVPPRLQLPFGHDLFPLFSVRAVAFHPVVLGALESETIRR